VSWYLVKNSIVAPANKLTFLVSIYPGLRLMVKR
jgi:hypothetical protein